GHDRPAADRLLRLVHPDLVARRVAETGVDTVGLLRGLLEELHAAGLELLVAGPAVVRGEEQAARGALRHDRHERVPRLGVEHRWARDGHQGEGDVGLSGNAYREPAEVPHL